MDPLPKVGKLPEVQATLLKRRKALASGRAKEIQRNIENRRKDKPQRRVKFKRLESYLGQARRQERDLKRANRVAREMALDAGRQKSDILAIKTATTSSIDDDEQKDDIKDDKKDVKPIKIVKKKPQKKIEAQDDEERSAAFVVRVRGINQVHPKVREAMVVLNLLAVNRGVFVRLNETSRRLLKICEPYIIWGVPTEATVRELVYKRGQGRWPPAGSKKKAIPDDQGKARAVKHTQFKKVALSDNKTIEECLGRFDIVCTDDIVHQLTTCGPAFKAVCSFLLPFRLSVPRGGWRKKSRVFQEGGDFGEKGAQIDAILRKMI